MTISAYAIQNANLTRESNVRGLQTTLRTKKSISTEVGIGAGAEILQDLEIDSLKLTDWEEKPSCIMRLYFVFVEQFEQIKSKGIKNLEGKKEGYLHDLPVG